MGHHILQFYRTAILTPLFKIKVKPNNYKSKQLTEVEILIATDGRQRGRWFLRKTNVYI